MWTFDAACPPPANQSYYYGTASQLIAETFQEGTNNPSEGYSTLWGTGYYSPDSTYKVGKFADDQGNAAENYVTIDPSGNQTQESYGTSVVGQGTDTSISTNSWQTIMSANPASIEFGLRNTGIATAPNDVSFEVVASDTTTYVPTTTTSYSDPQNTSNGTVQCTTETTTNTTILTLSEVSVAGKTYVVGTAQTTSAYATGISLDHVEFDTNEWAWSFTAPPQDGIFALDEIADEITETSWKPPESLYSVITAANPEGMAVPYTVSNLYSLTGTIALTYQTVWTRSEYITTTTFGEGFDALPEPIGLATVYAEDTYLTTYTNTVTVVTGWTLSEYTYTISTNGTTQSTISTAMGNVSTTTASSWVGCVGTVPTAFLDEHGNVIGTMEGNVLSGSLIEVTEQVVFGTNVYTGYTSYQDTATEIGFSGSGFTISENAESGFDASYSGWITGLAVYTSFAGTATVYEATFNSGFRFGTDGKYDAVNGPNGSVYYPFWTQVWSSLWMPMAYPVPVSTTYAGEDGTDLTSTLSYSWGSSGAVSMSSVWSDTAASSTYSSSQAFQIEAVGEDDYSYSTTYTVAGIGVVGGTQWDDNEVSAILGKGIWRLTTNDASGGTNSDQITVTDYSTINPSSDILVAFQAIPAWTSTYELSGPFTNGNYDLLKLLVVFEKWAI